MGNSRSLWVCFVGIVMALSLFVFGAAEVRAADIGDWELTLTPYVWTVGIDGDIGVLGLPPSSVDMSFSDLLDYADMAFSVSAEMKKDRWAIIADTMFYALSGDSGPIEIDIDILLTELDVAYRLGGESGAVEVLGGLRYLSVINDVEGLLPPAPIPDIEDAEFWVDALVGARTSISIGEKWSIPLRADVGGGGSDLTWHALTGVEWQISEGTSVGLVYRHLDVDFENDGMVFDVVLSGLTLGARIQL